MDELPIAPVGRILKSAGAERVSDEAKKALAVVLEDIGMNISGQAVKLAEHAGRKTVDETDIELACKSFE